MADAVGGGLEGAQGLLGPCYLFLDPGACSVCVFILCKFIELIVCDLFLF